MADYLFHTFESPSMAQAVSRAAKLARKSGEIVYVVYDDGYQVATDGDMDTFFLGLEPMAAIEPNGEVTT